MYKVIPERALALRLLTPCRRTYRYTHTCQYDMARHPAFTREWGHSQSEYNMEIQVGVLRHVTNVPSSNSQHWNTCCKVGERRQPKVVIFTVRILFVLESSNSMTCGTLVVSKTENIAITRLDTSHRPK